MLIELPAGRENHNDSHQKVSQHQEQINRVTQEVLDATLSDMWAAGDRDAIATKGLHFSDATQDMRLTYIEQMRSLPFEGYVAMARLPS